MSGRRRAPVLRELLQTRRRGITLWSVSMALICGLYTGMYPMMEQADVQTMLDALPPAMIEALGYEDMTSAAGYVGSAIYGLIGFVLLLIFAIMTGARLVAGDEEDGLLELELSSPLPRDAIYLQRLGALWAMIGALVVVILVSTLLLAVALGLDIGLGDVLAASVSLWLIAGLFGSLAFAVGAASGRRSISLGVASGVAVLSFMANAIGPTVGVGWVQEVSPVGWYMADNPVTAGLQPLGIVLLFVSSSLVGVAGWWRFRQRDLMT